MLTTARQIGLTVFLIVALHASPYGVQDHRYFASVASLVEDASFAISPRFGLSHPDFVQSHGQYFPNMPPGVAMLLGPSYWVYAHVAPNWIKAAPEMYESVFSLWAVVTVTAPILALAAVVMFKLVERLTGESQRARWLAIALIAGTPVFSYSTGLWSHQYTMSLMLAGTYVVVTQRSPAWLGAIMGSMLLIEHQAPLAIGLLGLFWLWARRREGVVVSRQLQDVIHVALAFLPFAAVLLYYNHTVTGSVLRSPVSIWYETNIPGQPLFVWPSLASLFGLTFSTYRGIFVYTPILLLSVAAIVRGRVERTPVIWFAYAVSAAFFLLCVSYVQWGMGVAFGPRYFTTALPFALIPAAFWPVATVRRWVLASILVNWAGATTNASVDLLTNVIGFAYRGPMPRWVEYAQAQFLPTCCGIRLSIMTPFWFYVALGAALWFIWRSPRSASSQA